MHSPTDFCSSPDSCCKNLDVESSTGLQRAPMCPRNVRAGGETIQWAPSTLQILLADSKTESWESISLLIHF